MPQIRQTKKNNNDTKQTNNQSIHTSNIGLEKENINVLPPLTASESKNREIIHSSKTKNMVALEPTLILELRKIHSEMKSKYRIP